MKPREYKTGKAKKCENSFFKVSDKVSSWFLSEINSLRIYHSKCVEQRAERYKKATVWGLNTKIFSDAALVWINHSWSLSSSNLWTVTLLFIW